MEKTTPPLSELLDNDLEELKRSGDLRQGITIASTRPIECSSSHCLAVSRRIVDDSEYVLINTRNGMVVLHLVCCGINPNGKLGSPQFNRYVGSQIMRRLQQ